MATEEIEISELEFTEELASDNLVPVESSTDTKATSLQAIKNWLSNFFVKKTGDESIYGHKSFEDVIYRRVKGLDINTIPSSSQYFDWLSPRDENGISIGFFGTTQRADGSHLSRLGVSKYIDGIGIYQELGVGIDKEGSASAYSPNPKDNSNTNNIATTSWTRRNIKCIPNFSAISLWGTNVNRNADVDGIIFGKWSTNSNSSLRSVLKINNVEYGVGNTSIEHNAYSFFSLPVAKGDNIVFTGETTLSFSPFKGVSL